MREEIQLTETIKEMLSLPFLVRALAAGVMLSLCSSVLGVSLVLKRYSMIGDGLSHVAFGALAVASALNFAPLYVALPVVVAAAFLLLRISSSGRFGGDCAVALISTGSLAVGVTALSFSPRANTDLNSYMFGSVLALSRDDMILSAVLCSVVAILYVLFYNRIFAVTFDETFARTAGIHAELYNMMLAVLTAFTIVLGMRLVGALLISALIIFPPLSSMRVFSRFRPVIICSALVSVVCFTSGIAASYFLETPAGASVVCVNIAAFAVFALIGKILHKY